MNRVQPNENRKLKKINVYSPLESGRRVQKKRSVQRSAFIREERPTIMA